MNEWYRLIKNPAFQRGLRVPDRSRDDALQDACEKLLRRNQPITEELLRTTAWNCYKDCAKADSRRHARELRRAGIQDQNTTSRKLQSVIQFYAVDPSANIERHETRATILRACRAANLPSNYHCALWAWIRDEVAEFSKKRSIPVASVRVWIHRALKKLKPYLERAGLGPD